MAETPGTTPPPGKPPAQTPSKRGGVLDAIEKIGNRLPDPAILFLIGAVIVMLASGVADWTGWEVVRKQPVEVVDPQTGETRLELEIATTDTRVLNEETGEVEVVSTPQVIRPVNLLSSDGLYWAISSMVTNFMQFPPLGIVLVGMLGVGVAERTGLIGALLKVFMAITPARLLTPATVFIGVMSSATSDAGYVVLPPLAALLYMSVGRSPLSGIAAVFAGVSAGFSANLFPTGLDPMLAELTQTGTVLIDEGYRVNPLCNWWFMIVSTVMATLVGWFVTARFVEPRFEGKPADEGGPRPPDADMLSSQKLTDTEKRGLRVTGVATALLAAILLSMVLVPGWPLQGKVPLTPAETTRIQASALTGAGLPAVDAEGVASTLSARLEGERPEHEVKRAIDDALLLHTAPVTDAQRNEIVAPALAAELDNKFDRWVQVIVPLLFIAFLVPGVVYGMVVGELRNSKDLARLMVESMAAMAPIIVLAFFAAQFIEYFRYSNLGTMLALSGGEMLAKAGLPTLVLLVLFILLTAAFNMFVGSMSAKYALFAPIFVPMLMIVGISPELTQAAYRIGDSVTNIITPLNSYLVIILVFMQRYVSKSGMGTLIAMMLPYSIAFTIAWTILLAIWLWTGLPLGPGGGLTYTPS